ncbi:hypothetical protein POM88_054039 [Heracleum sosnowskyi]|uniref:Uncharacterized protein n=1 Tax=Heracleum sosnowskyi TaxID=360622 RepID=A0AAD8GNG6_9APIA|nr:hypothetical protein POM88_054039 [Heracleum sosnowskyi]
MLSFHSVYEGITIGISGRSSKAWRALWVVSLHKIFAATIPDHPLMSCAAYSFVFAISTPIGVGTEIVIDSTVQGVVADWIYGIYIGISSGINFSRVLSTKFLSVLVGVAVITVIMIWESLHICECLGVMIFALPWKDHLHNSKSRISIANLLIICWCRSIPSVDWSG